MCDRRAYYYYTNRLDFVPKTPIQTHVGALQEKNNISIYFPIVERVSYNITYIYRVRFYVVAIVWIRRGLLVYVSSILFFIDPITLTHAHFEQILRGL